MKLRSHPPSTTMEAAGSPAGNTSMPATLEQAEAKMLLTRKKADLAAKKLAAQQVAFNAEQAALDAEEHHLELSLRSSQYSDERTAAWAEKATHNLLGVEPVSSPYLMQQQLHGPVMGSHNLDTAASGPTVEDRRDPVARDPHHAAGAAGAVMEEPTTSGPAMGGPHQADTAIGPVMGGQLLDDAEGLRWRHADTATGPVMGGQLQAVAGEPRWRPADTATGPVMGGQLQATSTPGPAKPRRTATFAADVGERRGASPEQRLHHGVSPERRLHHGVSPERRLHHGVSPERRLHHDAAAEHQWPAFYAAPQTTPSTLVDADRLAESIETMEAPDFKDFAKEMVDFISGYLENIRDRPVVPSVKPGYLRELVPATAPEQAEPWQAVMSDIERVVMSGVTHWHSPRFHAYYPTANSYPAIVADMLSGAIACIGFTWIASPACTELEVVMLDWLGQMLGLPEAFLARSGGAGGGVIQGTASEATLVALLGAKARALQRYKRERPELSEADIVAKLVGYCSKQAHSSVERAGLLGGVRLRLLEPDAGRRLRGDVLADAIRADRDAGLLPFYVVATLGTTSSCTFDALEEMGEVANREDVWLHVDAAYAGSAFICPELRYLMKGVELANSFNFNPHKWLLVNFDCSAMWLKEPGWVVDAFNVDPLYLKHDQQGSAPDYRHWQIPLGRRFRALKLWFVLRLYGVENLQAHIRKHVALAHHFEKLCLDDERFEVVEEVVLGLVCFRLKGANELNEKLLKHLNGRGNIHLVPSKIGDTYFLRLAICSRFSEKSDIEYSWKEISLTADEVIKDNKEA